MADTVLYSNKPLCPHCENSGKCVYEDKAYEWMRSVNDCKYYRDNRDFEMPYQVYACENPKPKNPDPDIVRNQKATIELQSNLIEKLQSEIVKLKRDKSFEKDSEFLQMKKSIDKLSEINAPTPPNVSPSIQSVEDLYVKKLPKIKSEQTRKQKPKTMQFLFVEFAMVSAIGLELFLMNKFFGKEVASFMSLAIVAIAIVLIRKEKRQIVRALAKAFRDLSKRINRLEA